MTTPHILFRAIPAFAAAIAAFAAPATGPVIGMAAANGSFEIDRSRVTGSATLFSGSTIETAGTALQIQLDGGQRLRLSTETRAQVYEKKVVLESGFGQFEAAPGYVVEARTLRISAISADTVTRIRLAPGHKVMVAAVRGSVRVTNSAGLLVATVPAGASLDFEPADTPAPVTQVSGCLLQKAGKFILAEQTTNTVLELRGQDLAREIGNRVSITGSAATSAVSVPGASHVVQTVAMKLVAKGGCSAIAKKLGATAAVGAGGAGAAAAGTATGGAATAGIGTAATVAVVGGVAAAATVGGLAAVGSLPGQGEDSPAVSR